MKAPQIWTVRQKKQSSRLSRKCP